MRGKEHLRQNLRYRDGITPAYAGKRKKRLTMTAADGDHPRLCGEKVSTTANATQQAGSPPPMRGKAFDANGDVTAAGITPAYAGKSWTCKCPVPESRDHPRLCGEKVRLICWRKIGAGSPPPMRGKAGVGCSGEPLMRITPAYAGKR